MKQRSYDHAAVKLRFGDKTRLKLRYAIYDLRITRKPNAWGESFKSGVWPSSATALSANYKFYVIPGAIG